MYEMMSDMMFDKTMRTSRILLDKKNESEKVQYLANC